ncbi:LLM class F420-dependent oxidoreductase [Mycobacterium sp. pW045]|uniref:LLM class F420-dependent oxidoreductase n=1 Tax=Mycobacterium sp. pW045 TaxID=3238984 RepID=UPI00351BBAA9
MRVGLFTPVVIQVPGTASEWEADGGIGDIAEIATAADELGYTHLTCSEHVAVPVEVAALRGATYWDPLATLSFLAARTRRIRLVTSVLVLGYHHPLEIAKRYGTLDRVSAGRLTLGVGVGSLREEFDLLGCAWEDRGARADDAMKALRASLSTSRPAYHGDYYRYDSLIVEPCAVQPRVPIWVGGRTRRSLRRAVELGDGWTPFGLTVDKIAKMLGSIAVPDDFAVVLATPPLDPIGAPQRATDQIERLAEAGATDVSCVISAQSVGHFCDQLAALAQLTNLAEEGS